MLPKTPLDKTLVNFCFLTFFAVFVVVPAAFAQKSSPLVETVDIVGNRRLTDAEILGYIKVRPGDRFDEAAAQADLKTLWNLGWFNNTSTNAVIEKGIRGDVHLIFSVHELPLIAEIRFQGLRSVTEGEIMAELREGMPTFQYGMPYDPTKLRAVRAMVIKFLAMRGFDNARVIFTEEEISATSLNISLIINETPNEP